MKTFKNILNMMYFGHAQSIKEILITTHQVLTQEVSKRREIDWPDKNAEIKVFIVENGIKHDIEFASPSTYWENWAEETFYNKDVLFIVDPGTNPCSLVKIKTEQEFTGGKPETTGWLLDGKQPIPLEKVNKALEKYLQ